MSKILKLFLVLRILSCFCVQTWFVPDETWQVTEVAHYWTFKYGYLCWEWREGIRSILYPGFFSLIYYALYLFHLDFSWLLIHVPRLLSAVFFSFGDYYMYKVSSKLFGSESQYWIAIFISSSWFLAYCAPRTLTSCAEMTFLAMSLYSYPWGKEQESISTKYLTLGGFGCAIRPTLAIFLIPYCIRHLYACKRKIQLMSRYIYNVAVIGFLTSGVDCLFYGKFTIVPWNFFKFNFLSGLSSHYGTHPWHWYFSQGLPSTCGIHFVPIVLGIITNFRKYAPLAIPSLWGIFAHSLFGHKEFRFLLPIIPLLLSIGGDFTHSVVARFDIKRNRTMKRAYILSLALIIPNAVFAVYMGLIHQRGPLDVMIELRNYIQKYPNTSVLFLTPCHSTPLYSHLHLNIPVQFLTCEPNLQNITNYKDEADIFFEDEMTWIRKNLLQTDNEKILPTCIVIYNTIEESLMNFFRRYNYKVTSIIFNSHFYDGNRGTHFHLYCNTNFVKKTHE